MSNADSDGREYREGNKSFIDYNGYKYKYSNPLKCNNGRNWKCINSRCIATLKTELNKEGNVTYSARFTLITSQMSSQYQKENLLGKRKTVRPQAPRPALQTTRPHMSLR